ncbi:TIR domain-containing protein [Rhizobium leguminosarum]|nr:TIR domain-containing protein [Rhizobium ruizarguesonis]
MAFSMPSPRGNDMNQTYRFAAFISYRQDTKDASWARWLHRCLETYRTPRALVETGVRGRIGRIFRDAEELEATPNLSERIRDALRESEYLVVICSPRIRGRLWVEKEVEYFIELGRRSNVLLFLIEGDHTTSFPLALGNFDSSTEMPLAANVAEVGGMFRRRWAHLPLLRLVAALLNCPLDALIQRDQARSRRRNRYVGTAIAAAILLGTCGFGYLVQRRVSELIANSHDSLELDPQLSLLLARRAFESSSRYLGINKEAARAALENTILKSRLRARFRVDDGHIRGLAWSSDGIIAAGGERRGNVTTWNRNTQQYGPALSIGRNVHRLAFAPNDKGGSRLAIADSSRVLRIWNLTTDDVSLFPTGNMVLTVIRSDVSWCTVNDQVATTDGRDTVFIWDLSKPDAPPLKFTDPLFGSVNSVSWSPRCRAIGIGGGHGVVFWPIGAEHSVEVGRQGHGSRNINMTEPEGVLRVQWDPLNPSVMATSGYDRTARIWSVPYVDFPETSNGTPSEEAMLTGHAGAVYDIALFDDIAVATASADGKLRIWHPVQYSTIYSSTIIPTDHRQAMSVVWSPNGDEIASGGEDNFVNVWHATDGGEQANLGGKDGSLGTSEGPEPNEVHFLLDGEPLTDAQLHELAVQRSVRDFTDDERNRYGI